MSKRIITMGTWENKPIEWIVLKETNETLLILSRYLIETGVKYNRNDEGNSWHLSDIRKYLNEKYFNELFNDIERKNIINHLINENIKDNIFLLSVSEASELLTQEERKTGDNWWWLRTASPHSSNSVAYVWQNGIINDNYVNFCHASSGGNGSNGVRPAMWVLKDYFDY